MVKPDEVAFLDAIAQADLVRRGEVKAAELVDAAIERIERFNPTLNAVITPLYEEGRAIARGQLDGPFAGVPFLLKDIRASYGGVRMACGSAFLQDFVPRWDCELVVRLKRAGLVILGKSNTPEFGLLPTTEPRLFGPTCNPWDLSLTAGGSSGGAAAAVAAGLVPAAHASDGGGSIRIPASCCGLFGLKPTRARNPLGPGVGDVMSGLVVEHAVTRTVRDSAALLDVTAGPDMGDPYCAPPPGRPFLEEVGAPPGRLRIAYTTTPPSGVVVHADCVSAVRDAATLCADLGHELVEAAPSVDGTVMARAFAILWAGGCAWTIDSAAAVMSKTPTADQFEPSTWALYEIGQRRSASEYLLALTTLQRIAREVARFFLDYDVWLTPTLGEPPVLLGTFDSPPDNPLYAHSRAGDFVPFTPICNATGQPAMSVPLFWNAEGLPIGTHFVGRFGNEATLFRLAAQLEEARPWASRRPPTLA